MKSIILVAGWRQPVNKEISKATCQVVLSSKEKKKVGKRGRAYKERAG